MQGELTGTGWNELQFLSLGEFKRMAPPILRLEVTRLDRILETGAGDTAFRNSLVRARFALRQFVECVSREENGALEHACVDHLCTAIMNISFLPEELDEPTRDTCRYVLDRLNYVYHRIGLIY